MTRADIGKCVTVGMASILALTLAACGGEETTAQKNQSGSQASSDKAALKIGEETTLKSQNDTELKVQALQVEDPMKAPPPRRGSSVRERPQPGRRFIGVHVRLTNIGKKTYSDAPLNGARLVTSVRKAATPTVLLGGKCKSGNFGTKLRLAPGASRKGCLPFQVKRAAKVTAFQLRLDSGYGPETGKWAVR